MNAGTLCNNAEGRTEVVVAADEYQRNSVFHLSQSSLQVSNLAAMDVRVLLRWAVH